MRWGFPGGSGVFVCQFSYGPAPHRGRDLFLLPGRMPLLVADGAAERSGRHRIKKYVYLNPGFLFYVIIFGMEMLSYMMK